MLTLHSAEVLEPEFPAAQCVYSPGALVDGAVVSAAEQDEVVQVGASAVVPGLEVVGVAPLWGSVAAGGLAVFVADG